MEASKNDIREVREQLSTQGGQLAAQGERLTGVETRLDGVETRLDRVETRLIAMDERLTAALASQTRLMVTMFAAFFTGMSVVIAMAVFSVGAFWEKESKPTPAPAPTQVHFHQYFPAGQTPPAKPVEAPDPAAAALSKVE